MDDPWLIQVDVPDADVDEASGLLWEAGVEGVWEIDLGAGRTRLAGGVRRDAAEATAARIGHRWSTEAYPATHDGWLDSWRPYARPVDAGRFHVHPAWQAAHPPAGSTPLAIDAGRSFGQGGHATTRLVLEAVDRLVGPGDRVLDVGCGSGILAVAAAAAGAGRVLGVDIEADALTVARENADRNGVTAVTTFRDRPVEDVTGSFDLVLANILANVLRDLAEPIAARLAPSGALVLGGLLEHQRDPVAERYAALGLTVVGERRRDDWLALELRHP